MRKFNLLLILGLLVHSCSFRNTEERLHPMVDGSKREYAKLKIDPIKISNNVNLYIFQNDNYVWISYDYPKGSFGTLDMVIQTEKIKKPLNLHVSAQLGEWPLGEEDKKPQTPTSDLWWNMDGWIANNLWANGIDTITYDTPEFKIRNGEIREVQLDKERFGRGEWKIKLKINAIKNEKGKFYSLVFPQNEEYYKIAVN